MFSLFIFAFIVFGWSKHNKPHHCEAFGDLSTNSYASTWKSYSRLLSSSLPSESASVGRFTGNLNARTGNLNGSLSDDTIGSTQAGVEDLTDRDDSSSPKLQSYLNAKSQSWSLNANDLAFVDQSRLHASLDRLRKSLGIDIPLLGSNAIPSEAEISTSIFCNRELNMKGIIAVGFDMDWTLAQYNEDFDSLAFDGAKEKLYHWLGYPKEVMDIKYLNEISRRCCIIDKRRGNLIKLDRNNYVYAAMHGRIVLSSDERKSLYRVSRSAHEELNNPRVSKFDNNSCSSNNNSSIHRNSRQQQQFTSPISSYATAVSASSGSSVFQFQGPDFVNIDTPFSLVDASLYMQVVHLKDSIVPENSNNSSSYSKLRSLSYEDIWTDVRRCVDRCHKDGVIKKKVEAAPEKYIVYDPNIFPMLEEFKRSGRKVFLVTNSLWDYTQVAMNYLYNRKRLLGNCAPLEWTNYFDVIIVGANKPAFVADNKVLPIFRVSNDTGSLANIDSIPNSPEELSVFLARGKVFQGGSARLLHQLLSVPTIDGEQILYVGDHMFADVLRNKKSLGWRTCLIVPELQHEIVMHQRLAGLRRDLIRLRADQYTVEAALDRHMLQSLINLNNNRDRDNQSAASEMQQQQQQQQQQQGSADDAPTVLDLPLTFPARRYYPKSPSLSLSEIKAQAKSMLPTIGSTIGGFQEKAAKDVQQQYLDRLASLRREIKEKMQQYDFAFDPTWGPLFKAGFKETRFAKQVFDFACIYTSRASNLGFCSPQRRFQSKEDRMPHDNYSI